MNIFYNDNTLFVNIYEELNSYNVNRLKLRVFKIVTEYDIENVVLTTSGSVTVSDSRIKSTNTGIFVPDLSINDLISDITVTFSNSNKISNNHSQ